MESNFERLKSMSVDKLAEWIDENGMFDNSPWMTWWNQKYCENCEEIKGNHGADGYYYRMCFAYCELNHKCRFFPNLDDAPNNEDIIKMWLEAEVEE
jgi:hypothetical protein